MEFYFKHYPNTALDDNGIPTDVGDVVLWYDIECVLANVRKLHDEITPDTGPFLREWKESIHAGWFATDALPRQTLVVYAEDFKYATGQEASWSTKRKVTRTVRDIYETTLIYTHHRTGVKTPVTAIIGYITIDGERVRVYAGGNAWNAGYVTWQVWGAYEAREYTHLPRELETPGAHHNRQNPTVVKDAHIYGIPCLSYRIRNPATNTDGTPQQPMPDYLLQSFEETIDELHLAGWTVLRGDLTGCFAIAPQSWELYQQDIQLLRDAHHTEPNEFWNPDQSKIAGIHPRWVQLCRIRYYTALQHEQQPILNLRYADPVS